jgi:hypothetical protein
MSHCTAREDRPNHAGACLGGAGHTGRHWCLLGHVWFTDDIEEEEDES